MHNPCRNRVDTVEKVADEIGVALYLSIARRGGAGGFGGGVQTVEAGWTPLTLTQRMRPMCSAVARYILQEFSGSAQWRQGGTHHVRRRDLADACVRNDDGSSGAQIASLDRLKYRAKKIAVAEPTVAIGREGRVVGNLVVKIETAEPAIGEVAMAKCRRLRRNRWRPSIGTRGRVQSESLAAIVGIRNDGPFLPLNRSKTSGILPVGRAAFISIRPSGSLSTAIFSPVAHADAPGVPLRRVIWSLAVPCDSPCIPPGLVHRNSGQNLASGLAVSGCDSSTSRR
jgi:hypothetical protein